MDDVLLPSRLRELREQAGLTKTALAKPRYTVSFVSQIEAGRRKPSPDALAFFADRLGVSPGYLLTGVPDGTEDRIRYQLELVRNDLRLGDLDDADAHLTAATAEAAEFGFPRLSAEALALRGELEVLRGDLRGAIDTFEEALESPLPPRAAGMAISSLSRAYRSLGDLAYAVDLVERFLASPDGPLDPGVASELHSVLISLYFERGDIVRAERAAERALASARVAGSMEARANALWDASRVLAEARRWDEALLFANRARGLMEDLHDHRAVARLHNAYAFICLEADPPRVEEAREHLDAAEIGLRENGAPGDLAYVFTERARLALMQRRPKEAEAAADDALEHIGDDELERARCLFLKARAQAMRRKPEEATASLTEAAGLFAEHGARQQEAACWRELGELALDRGAVADAVEALRAGLTALDPNRSRA